MPDRQKLLKMGDHVVLLPGRSFDEIFLMSLCLVVSLPILLGATPAPGSLYSLMNPVLVFGWSLTLAVGSIVVLSSLLFKDRITGMIVEQFGSACLGVASAIYAVVIFITSYDSGGAFAASLVLGFALARGLRFRSYQKILKKVQTVKALKRLEEGNGH